MPNNNFNLQDFSSKMEESLKIYNRHVNDMAIGNRNIVGLIEKIEIEVYGSYMPVIQLASVSLSDHSTICVSAFDKSNISSIEKGISSYNKNFSCFNQNNTLYVKLPPMTEEVRKDFVKTLKSDTEDTKVKIRDIRRDAMTHIKHLADEINLSEDSQNLHKKEVEDLTHKIIEKIDEIFYKKEQEILGV